MLQEHFFDTGAVSINYAAGPPSGPPLLLLHGIPGRWQEFLPIIPALSTRWRIYALDLRGHGKSGRVPGMYRPAQYVADVTAFLQNRVAEPAVLFGMSAGGLVALAVAARLPGRVHALALGDSPVDIEALAAWMSTDEFAGYFAALQEFAGSVRPVAELARALGNLPGQAGMDAASLRAWATTISHLDPGVLEYHAQGRGREFLADFDVEGILRRILCPVLLLRGNPDLGALMSAACADHASLLLADAVQVSIEDAGHDLGLGAWRVAPLLRAVVNFIETYR